MQLDRRQPLPYTRVQPTVVVEVDADVAYDIERGRWRHRVRFVGVRADLAVDDVPPQASGF